MLNKGLLKLPTVKDVWEFSILGMIVSICRFPDAKLAYETERNCEKGIH